MTGYVYAISNGRGAVKIGFSRDPERRFQSIRGNSADTYTLLGYAAGTRLHEFEAHTLLAAARIRGEWFHETHRHVALFLSMLPARPLPVGSKRDARRVYEPVADVASTASEVIDRLGGSTAVARALNTTQPRVANWKMRGRIPPEMFIRVREHARAASFAVAPAAFGMETTS